MSIGASLAAARRQAGLTVTEVSRRTRIRESIIRDIENGDFSSCGGDFYARGHIRGIASVVGADPAPLISAYDAEHGPPGPVRAADVFEPSRPVKIREPRSPSLSMIVAVVLLAVIGFGAYRLVSHHTPAKPLAAQTRLATASAKPRVRPSPTLSPSPAPTGLTIRLDAVAACWVLLTDSSTGAQIYMGTIPAGSSMTWTEDKAVKLDLGYPPGVKLTVNGKLQATDVNNPETLTFSPRFG